MSFLDNLNRLLANPKDKYPHCPICEEEMSDIGHDTYACCNAIWRAGVPRPNYLLDTGLGNIERGEDQDGITWYTTHFEIKWCKDGTIFGREFTYLMESWDEIYSDERLLPLDVALNKLKMMLVFS